MSRLPRRRTRGCRRAPGPARRLLGRPAAGPGGHRPAAPLRLDASVAQFRFDEGTRNLKAGVTNHTDHDIRVSRATLSWDGFAFPTVPLTRRRRTPRADRRLHHRVRRSAVRPAPATEPVLVAVVDGRTTRLPLRVEDPGLLDRLHAKACAAQVLARAATVHLRLATSTETLRGRSTSRAELVVRHRPGATGRVLLVDLGGSVLLDLVPRAGPTRFRASSRRTRTCWRSRC